MSIRQGPAYVAHETVRFGRQLGLAICTTPPYSPESNGMAEAFVKTFKRDYVWVSNTCNSLIVLKQLPAIMRPLRTKLSKCFRQDNLLDYNRLASGSV